MWNEYNDDVYGTAREVKYAMYSRCRVQPYRPNEGGKDECESRVLKGPIPLHRHAFVKVSRREIYSRDQVMSMTPSDSEPTAK